MSKLIHKWSRLGDYFSDDARDVRTKCMYTDAKIGIYLVGMKVLRKQIRLFAYSGKLEYTGSY